MTTDTVIRIVDYDDSHQPVFELLNREWIQEHFELEPLDLAVLGDPRKHIIEPGGHILVGLYKNEPAGVVGLRKISDQALEFTKMAVDPVYRRKGLAGALTHAAIAQARKMGAKKIILYSNTLQAAAIILYRKTGFTEVPMGETVYARGNIKMALTL